ncbi:MAG: hypothetical protein K2Q09_02395 [Phycisphaerales bacterium]|nr:hypothetical protein [Phycisphaerales bacterium]
MHEDVPTKAIAACFGLAGFVVAVVCGLVVENPVDVTLGRAIPALFVCYAVGYAVGVLTTRAISQNIQAAAQAAAAAATEAAEAGAKIAQVEAGAGGAQRARGVQANTPIMGATGPATPAARAAA